MYCLYQTGRLRHFFMYPKWRSTQLDFVQGCLGTVETGFLFEHVCSPDGHVFGARTLDVNKFWN